MGPLPRPREDWRCLRLLPWLPRGWKRDGRRAADILSWAQGLQWAVGEVRYAELIVNLGLTTQRSLPAHPKYSLRMTVLPMQERAAKLQQVVRALYPHMHAGELLPAKETPRSKSLIPLGSGASLGIARSPYFVSQGKMVR